MVYGCFESVTMICVKKQISLITMWMGLKSTLRVSRQFVIKILDVQVISISHLMPNHHVLIANIIPAVRRKHLMRL